MIIYMFIHIYYLTLPLRNDLRYFWKQKILVPLSGLTAVVRQLLPAKLVDRNSTGFYCQM